MLDLALKRQNELLSEFGKMVHDTLNKRTTIIEVTYIPSNVKAYRDYVSLFKGNITAQGFKFDMEEE